MSTEAEDEAELVRKARIGSHEAFRALVVPYQAELQRHCYRMTGSVDDADDIVQETLFRAWRGLGTYVSRGSFRAWLYRIATNRTLDLVGSAVRRREFVNTAGEPSWLQPYPGHGLDDTTGDRAADLDAVGLAYILALQQLVPRQRAALLLCDVLGFSAVEAAESLATTVAAANSLLQRARATMAATEVPGRIEPANAGQAKLVSEFIEAWRRADASALASLLSADAHLTMPPHELEFFGATAIVQLLLDEERFARPDDVVFLTIRAGGEHGLATYITQSGTGRASRHCIMLFGAATDTAAKITGFTEDRVFDLLSLPATIPAEPR